MGLTKPRAAQIFNLDYKQSTRVVTATNITLTGGAPNLVDGVTLSLGDRVLVTGQTTGTQNGLYQVTTLGSGANGTWARTSDGNENGEIEAGMIVMVTEGTIYADTQWKLITDDPIVINTTALTFTQNYMANSISGGTSNVVVNSNANVTVSSAGTANVLTISNTGAFVSGVVSATGNITGGNILGNGRAMTGILFSNTSDAATANLTVDDFYLSAVTALNVTNSGAMSYLFDQYPGNNPTIYAVAGSTLAFRLAVTGHPFLIQSSGANYNTGLNHVTTSGTVTTGASAQGQVAGTLYWKIPGNISGTYTYQCAIHAMMVGNILISDPAAVSVTGNIQGGNLLTAGLISATGAITGAAITGTSLTVTTGNITAGNLLLSGAIIDSAQLDIQTSAANANIALAPNGTGVVTVSTQVSAVGNVTGGNIRTGGLVTATGNVVGGNVLTAGLISATSTITSAANVTGDNITTAGLITATGNITGGNLLTAGIMSSTGNGIHGNIITAGLITATGNITGNYILGNGALLTGVITSSSNINNGTSNVTVVSSGGNVTVGIGGISNVATFTTTGIIANSVAATNNGNATNFKVGDDAWLGDINTADTIGIRGQQNAANAYIVFGNADSTQLGRAGSGPLTYGGAFSASGNVTVSNLLTAGLISATSNIRGGNILTVGQVSATGNVSGNFFIGNGAFLTGITGGGGSGGSNIANGATVIDIPVSSGNIAMSVAGQSNTVVINLGSLTMYGTFAGPKTLEANVTVAAAVNGLLIGPVVLGNAYNITVPDGSTLYVYTTD
jgi:hypothetical protein